MTTIQHILFALFAGIPIFWQMCFATAFASGWMNPGWIIIAIVAGTFIPDIEFIHSHIWNVLKPYSVMLQAEGADDWKGPSWFHSLAGLLVNTFVFYVLVFGLINESERTENICFITAAFFIAYFLHLLQDFTCFPGICLFWPIRKKFYLTDLEQERDLGGYSYNKEYGRSSSSWPVILFTCCLVLVTWFVCFYFGDFAQTTLFTLGLAIGSIGWPFVQFLCGLFSEKTVLKVIRWAFFLILIPLCFRAASPAITEHKVQKRKWKLEKKRREAFEKASVNAKYGKGIGQGSAADRTSIDRYRN